MPVNNAIRNLAKDGRFSVDDANALKALVAQGTVSPAEAKETLQRYGDVMDPDAASALESFTGGTRSGSVGQMPSATLANGQNSPDVKTLQHGLMALGMRENTAAYQLPSGADGRFGAETKAAVTAFQSAHGISPTGVADPATMRALDGALRASPGAPPRPQAPTSLPQAATPQAPRPRRGLSAAAAPTATAAAAPPASPWKTVASAGDKSIASKEAANAKSIDDTGLGNYYGDHSDFANAVHSGDKAAVQAQLQSVVGDGYTLKSMTAGSVTVQDANGVSKTLKESSCIGWVMDNVKAAYTAAGKGDRFAEIEQRMKSTGMRGTILCEELKKDGWSAVFYSPKTADQLKAEGSTEKLAALRMAQAGKPVWKAGLGGSTGIVPDAVVTGYRDSQPDAKTDAMLKQIESSPFLVGVANGGIHTFVGHQGNIADFHWQAQPDDKGMVQEHPVRQWEWDTGLFMLPPGTWSTPARTTQPAA